MTTTRRPARSLTLTMKGFAAAWRAEQKAALAARPVEATAQCACCDTECSTATLAPLATEFTYERAVRDYSFERYDDLCACCRETFEAEYGRDEYSDPND